jgi:hypothetical protein
MGPAHMFALWSGVSIYLGIFWFLLILSMYAGIHVMDGARQQKPIRLFTGSIVCIFVSLWVFMNLFVSPFTNVSLMYDFSEYGISDEAVAENVTIIAVHLSPGKEASSIHRRSIF